MTFDDLATGGATLVIPADWHTGRGAFGGLAAGAALRAIAAQASGSARSFQCTFLAPPVGAQQIRVASIRAGTQVSFWSADLLDERGRVTVHATATFGAARTAPGSARWAPPQVPSAPPPPLHPPAPIGPGAPPFTQHVQFVPSLGGLFVGTGAARFGGWTRLAAPTTPDAALVVALLDAWPPAALAAQAGPPTRGQAAATVTLEVHFVADPAALGGDGWGFVEVVGVTNDDGYSSQDSNLWSRSGALLARSRQLVAML
jgi:acyl-CoA thioesterase